MAHWECKKCKGTNIIAIIDIFECYEIAIVNDNMEPQEILLDGKFIPVNEWLEIMFWENLKVEEYECKNCGYKGCNIEDMAEWIDPQPTLRIIEMIKAENKRLQEKIIKNEKHINRLKKHPITL